MSTAISVQQLSVRFRGRGRRHEVTALQALDFAIGQGSITGILGPNGSGKTTLLAVLAGLLLPTAGSATVLGLPPTDARLRTRLAFQPAGRPPLGVLSAREYLAWTGAQLGLPNAESDARAERWLARLDLLHTGRRALDTFSTGMQRRLSLAAALLGDPQVLLLDEPTAGLDPFGSAAVIEILRERATAGTTVLLASHQLLEVEEVCDEVLVLHEGALRARGTLAELLGTAATALVVRGLDAAALGRLGDLARGLGGEIVRCEPEREHVFALFRRLAGKAPAAAGAADAR
jgi:ABC-2 type transport system ATP-binding protein